MCSCAVHAARERRYGALRNAALPFVVFEQAACVIEYVPFRDDGAAMWRRDHLMRAWMHRVILLRGTSAISQPKGWTDVRGTRNQKSNSGTRHRTVRPRTGQPRL